jgi:uncharacterized protein (DUF1810 family)
MDNSLNRFTDAQEDSTRWRFQKFSRAGNRPPDVVYFPQIAGLGFSETSRYYAIRVWEVAGF